MTDTITTDVLVIGAGLAGERAAIAAAAEGNDVVILSLVPPRRSHSCAAQGGMQAALGNCAMGAGDSEDLHWLDTVKGSDWGADQEVARIFGVPLAAKSARPSRRGEHIGPAGGPVAPVGGAAALAAVQSGKLDLPAAATVAAVVCRFGSDGIAS